MTADIIPDNSTKATRRRFLGAAAGAAAIPGIISGAAAGTPTVSGGPAAWQSAGEAAVNSFYPAGIPAGVPSDASWSSRPLSRFFSTLSAAQAAFPDLNFAAYNVTLADEVDWCAWQACADHVYNAPNVLHLTYNFAGATIIAAGRYLVNRSVKFRGASIEIIGSGLAVGTHWRANTCWLNYNGPHPALIGGDAPPALGIFTVDFSGTSSGEGVFKCRGMGFTCDPSLTGISAPAYTNLNQFTFVTGIIVGVHGDYVEISDCMFYAGLWDGIQLMPAQLFTHIHDNSFYGVQRDGISCTTGPVNSTTQWYHRNEFGAVGRYQILCDCTGSVEAKNIFRDNSFEGGLNSSYFTALAADGTHPEDWWVAGVIANVALIQCGNTVIDGWRYEEAPLDRQWANLLLLACTNVAILNSTGPHQIACAAHRLSQVITPALATFQTAHGYADITAKRNYEAGLPGDYVQANELLIIKNVYNLLAIYDVGGVGLGAGHHFEDTTSVMTTWSIPVVDGTYGKIAGSRLTHGPTLKSIDNVQYNSCSVLDVSGSFTFGGPFDNTSKTGDLRAMPWFYARWLPNHAYSKLLPNASTLNIGNLLTVPTLAHENGFVYQCTTSGTSGNVEPTWTGGPVTDGTVVWTLVAFCFQVNEVGALGRVEHWLNAVREFGGAAAPSLGSYHPGDKLWYTAPTAAGKIGAVCIGGGSPGTWHEWGVIS
jgi:hypothetical protein